MMEGENVNVLIGGKGDRRPCWLQHSPLTFQSVHSPAMCEAPSKLLVGDKLLAVPEYVPIDESRR